MKVNLQDMKTGEIKAVSSSIIVIKTDDGIKAFSRYCSHEGADLSLGYVQDNKIHCPWHNLPFDVNSGIQPCQSLKNLREHKVEILGENEYEIS